MSTKKIAIWPTLGAFFLGVVLTLAAAWVFHPHHAHHAPEAIPTATPSESASSSAEGTATLFPHLQTKKVAAPSQLYDLTWPEVNQALLAKDQAFLARWGIPVMSKEDATLPHGNGESSPGPWAAALDNPYLEQLCSHQERDHYTPAEQEICDLAQLTSADGPAWSAYLTQACADGVPGACERISVRLALAWARNEKPECAQNPDICLQEGKDSGRNAHFWKPYLFEEQK